MSVRESLTLNEIKISYLEWHQGKEPLLLLHGLADHALVWSSLGDDLAADYHIIAPDLRGHGDSSKPTTGYSSEAIIADLEALMDDLGWQDAHILGHSWGGKLAAIWATKSPQRFRSLILVDPFFINKLPSWFKLTFPLLYRVLPFLKGMGPFASYQAAEQIAKKLKQYRGWSPLQQQVFQASVEQKSDGSWGSKFIVAARNQIFTDVMEVAGLNKTLAIPTLLITPKQGLNRTAWQLKLYHHYLSNLEIKTIAGNHWVFLVNPQEFNQTIAQFLHQQKIK
jgi:pimeloyl-ACP methyl ester carboxylesterase